MDFSNHLFRCYSLGHLMTEPRSAEEKKAGVLSSTCIAELIKIYIEAKYGRRVDIKSKYIDKGLGVEEDSITLYSRVKQKFFKKNETRLSNFFITGLPDLFEGEEITQTEEIIDIKSSWDLETFFNVLTKAINSLYYWQGQGYMALSGAKRYRVAYCLVDTPEILINDEKRKLMYSMGAGTDMDALYIEAADLLDYNMRFTDIPMEDRVIEFTFNQDDNAMVAMYERVKRCRDWLNEFDQSGDGQRIIQVADREYPVKDIWPMVGGAQVAESQLNLFLDNQQKSLPSVNAYDPTVAFEKILDKIDQYISLRIKNT